MVVNARNEAHGKTWLWIRIWIWIWSEAFAARFFSPVALARPAESLLRCSVNVVYSNFLVCSQTTQRRSHMLVLKTVSCFFCWFFFRSAIGAR